MNRRGRSLKRTLFAIAALAIVALGTPARAQDTAPAPSATPKAPAQQVSIEGAYVFDGKNSTYVGLKQIYNKQDQPSIYFGEEFSFFNSPCDKAAYCTNVGGRGTDLRLGVEIAKDIFFGAGLGSFSGRGFSGSGIGIGVEKLSRGTDPFEWVGSFFYYPSVPGTYACPVPTGCFAPGVTYNNAEYAAYRYSLGAHYSLSKSPFYVTVGVKGENGTKQGAFPLDFNHNGAYLGLGFRM